MVQEPQGEGPPSLSQGTPGDVAVVARASQDGGGRLPLDAELWENLVLRFQRQELLLEQAKSDLRTENHESLMALWNQVRDLANPLIADSLLVLESAKMLASGISDLHDSHLAFRELMGALGLEHQLGPDLLSLKDRVRNLEVQVGLVDPDVSDSTILPPDPLAHPPPARSPTPHEGRESSRASSEPPAGGLAWRSPEFPPPPTPFLSAVADLPAEIRTLHARIDQVETQMETRVQQAVAARLPGAVEQYLSGLGLTPELLKELGEHVVSTIASRGGNGGTSKDMQE